MRVVSPFLSNRMPSRSLTGRSRKNVLPLLQKQKGFRDELTLVALNGSEVVGISLWDQKEDAEAHNRTAYPEVQKLLTKVIEGTLRVQTYEVSTSTIHKVAARGVSG